MESEDSVLPGDFFLYQVFLDSHDRERLEWIGMVFYYESNTSKVEAIGKSHDRGWYYLKYFHINRMHRSYSFKAAGSERGWSHEAIFKEVE